jgi:hypothetical protein
MQTKQKKQYEWKWLAMLLDIAGWFLALRSARPADNRTGACLRHGSTSSGIDGLQWPARRERLGFSSWLSHSQRRHTRNCVSGRLSRKSENFRCCSSGGSRLVLLHGLTDQHVPAHNVRGTRHSLVSKRESNLSGLGRFTCRNECVWIVWQHKAHLTSLGSIVGDFVTAFCSGIAIISL